MKNIISLVLVVCLLAVGCNQSSILSQDKAAPIIKTNTVGPENNSYSYDGVVLTFEKSFVHEGYMAMFATKNGKKQKLADKIIKDCCGGGWPNFQKTDDPNIALLFTATGDTGFYQVEHYFIRISDLKVLKVMEDSYPSISVFDTFNYQSDIKLIIQPQCNIDGSSGGKKVSVKGIGVNNIVSLPISNRFLTCVAEPEFNLLHDPYTQLRPIGVTADLSKIYFTLGFFSFEKDEPVYGSKENYVYNTKTKNITKEQPQNLVYKIPEL